MKDKPLRIEGASVSFGSVEVFRHLSLEISRGEFVAVVGPSGCGKTTLLNLFSGFLKPTLGSVICSGRVRMVYQHDSLFPWQTAAQNIALGLRDLSSETERERQLEQMLRLINLKEFAGHYPHQLSGGMRQRVEPCSYLPGVASRYSPSARVDAPAGCRNGACHSGRIRTGTGCGAGQGCSLSGNGVFKLHPICGLWP